MNEFQYARCGRDFIEHQVSRVDEKIKHIAHPTLFRTQPQSSKLKTYCGLTSKDGVWWFSTVERDKWCPTCLEQIRMPYTLETEYPKDKVYVLARDQKHFNHWLRWMLAQIIDTNISATKFYPIVSYRSIHTSKEAIYTFLYYVSGLQRKDFKQIDNMIRKGVGGKPLCAICFMPMELENVHDGCILPMHYWKDGRVQTFGGSLGTRKMREAYKTLLGEGRAGREV